MRTLSFSFDSQMVASASEDLFIDIVSFDLETRLNILKTGLEAGEWFTERIRMGG